MAQESTPRDVAAERERLLEGLRAYGGQHREFSRRFAAWLGLHPTDAAALVEITNAEERGTPLSPARLSERISLSSGATTALLNRLERAGHVIRTRENADRRVVTLRSGPHTQERADEFFGPLAVRVDATLSRYPSELLEQLTALLTDLCATMATQLTHLEAQDENPARRQDV
ncbi:helix-turn-helix domain-containing protein [Streptomyces sp. MST-110588]|uniref:MarR family winged helix-turn-helix transcriptional regulator n=1 Tax=Streptomyces sp. MST-110588 TaxID=2833628 RepID=UPI001F5C663D|nr:helix-turn-helix domain-containing protein [Streptomyces sp. MST-110588]